MLTISRLIVSAAFAIALLLVVSSYVIFSGFGDRMLQQSVVQHSQSVAQVTFSSMLQVMNQGWKRHQVEAFATDLSRSVVGMPVKIDIYRAPAVSTQFGAINQAAPDAAMEKALKDGLPWDWKSAEGVRYLMPVNAKPECLGCHKNVGAGEVLGVISIHTGYQELMDETRLHLIIVLLLLAPLPIMAGFLATYFFDRRMHHFLHEIDTAISTAPSGSAPDFTGVKLHFREFRELMGHFKRLIKR